MGQYHCVVNLDKKEYLDPHQLGCGLKLREQLWCIPGTGPALIALLAVSNGRGGGDFQTHSLASSVVGRWGGDRIAIVGDYAEDSDLPGVENASQLYFNEGYNDISPLVAAFLEEELDGKFAGDGWRDFVPNNPEL